MGFEYERGGSGGGKDKSDVRHPMGFIKSWSGDQSVERYSVKMRGGRTSWRVSQNACSLSLSGRSEQFILIEKTERHAAHATSTNIQYSIFNSGLSGLGFPSCKFRFYRTNDLCAEQTHQYHDKQAGKDGGKTQTGAVIAYMKP